MNSSCSSVTQTAQYDFLLQSAIQYVRQGFPVVPLGDGGTEKAKIPQIKRWATNPFRTEKACSSWWNTHPQANIGLITGPESGLLVLDVDYKQGGAQSLRDIELPKTAKQSTGNGEHYFFYSKDSIRNSISRFGEGLDIRGTHGLVVAAPSIHPSGAIYQWQVPLRKESLAPAPRWMLSPPEMPTPLIDLPESDVATAGHRNTFLFQKTGELRRNGLKGTPLFVEVCKINLTRCHPPLESDEVEKIVTSVESTFKSSAKKPVLFHFRDCICKEPSKDPTLRHILHVISFHMDANGKPAYPTQLQIAAMTGYTERTVNEKIRKAVDLGLIRVVKHCSPGQRHANNVYMIPTSFYKEES
jgi:hypothetical protein